MFGVACERRARRCKLALGKFAHSLKKTLRSRLKTLICRFAQFRTCLWSCVSREVSGQEAGQPPRDEEPRVAQGRDLKESKPDRPASLSRDAVEGLCILCNRDWQP